jgi:hypothetical protein
MTRSGRRCRSIAAWALVACLALACRSAVAQQYASIEPKVKGAEANMLGGKVATILRDAAGPNDAAKKDLDQFFKGYLYPLMTSVDPVQLGKLGQNREQLFTRYINTAKSQGARDYINEITLKPMEAVAKNNFHPAVRYNAVLIIGQLDQQAGAKPLPEATEALLGFLEGDKGNDSLPTPVKLAALIGLQRHLRLGIDPALNDRITKAALAVADLNKAPADVTPKVYGWVRRQALQTLALQSAKGLTPPVHSSFVKFLGDETATVDDRCEAAHLLQAAMYKDAKGLDTSAMTLALGELARKVLTAEAKDAGDYLDKVVGNPGAFSGPGGMGPGEMRGPGGYGPGMDFSSLGMEDTTPHYEKRRMLDRSFAIADAADAVAAASSDEAKDRAKKLAQTIRTSADKIAAEAGETNISQTVVTLAGEVDQLIASWAPAGAAAPAGGDDKGGVEIPDQAPADAAG